MRPSRRASCSTTAWCPLRRTRRATSPLCRATWRPSTTWQAEILDTVLTRISQVPTGDLSIPIGSLTGSTLLAGRGPRITVRMESVGSSEANFRNAFTSAGINQTKHQIILTVDVSVSVLLPGFRTATKVSNSFIVAETVIVGTVPDTYTYFSTDPDTYEEDLKDYILNNS